MEINRMAYKDHTCSACEHTINKGSIYRYGWGKFPRYENDKQVGIEYATWKLHEVCPVTLAYGAEQLEDNDPADIPEVELHVKGYPEADYRIDVSGWDEGQDLPF